MDITFAHYRNRFCMFRTYYALAVGKVKPDGINMKVIELPDPLSKEQEEALIRGDEQAADLYLPDFLSPKYHKVVLFPPYYESIFDSVTLVK